MCCFSISDRRASVKYSTTLREGYLRDSADIDLSDPERYLLYKLQIHPDENECMTGVIYNTTDSIRTYD